MQPLALAAVLVLALALALAAATEPTTQPDFSTPGPCGSQRTTIHFQLPPSSNCSWRCSGVLHVHTPGNTNNAAAGPGCPFAAPYPLIVFVSGFLASASDYFAYSSHLASWGFAVLQYDFHLLPGTAAGSGNGLIHTDEAEVGFLPHFLALLASPAEPLAAAAAPQHQSALDLRGKLDLDNMGAAGHSRGGKIAALHFAGHTPAFKAAFLIDPVDGTSATAGHPGYPSAVQALAGQGKLLGLTGAGRLGPCNDAPTATGNWSSFWGVAAAAGSWLEVVPDAGHLQFADISSLLDWVCCRGCQGLLSHEEGISLAKVPLTAWFHKQLRGGPVPTSHSRSLSSSGGSGVSNSNGAFRRWVCDEEAAGKVEFFIKGQGDVCGTQTL